jgi:hypothetical protein
MKIRNGFVTNSSSASFLVSRKPGAKKLTVTLSVDLSENLNRDSILKTEEDVDNFLSYYKNYEEYREVILEEIRSGKEVLLAGAHSSDTGALALIYTNGILDFDYDPKEYKQLSDLWY